MPEDDGVNPKNGHIEGVNTFSTDIGQLNSSNLRSKPKMEPVAEESPSEDRWKAVSSNNFKNVTRTEL